MGRFVDQRPRVDALRGDRSPPAGLPEVEGHQVVLVYVVMATDIGTGVSPQERDVRPWPGQDDEDERLFRERDCEPFLTKMRLIAGRDGRSQTTRVSRR